MDDRANLGLIHSHAERIGCDHDLGFAAHEPVLRGGALLAGQTGMIDHGLTPQFVAQESRDGLAPRPAGGVDDRRSAVLIKRPAQLLHLGLVAPALDHGIPQVGTVEPGDEELGIVQRELIGDVAADGIGSRGRKARCRAASRAGGEPGRDGRNQVGNHAPTR